AEADAHDHGRAGLRAGLEDALQNKLVNAANALGGYEHAQEAHVLRTRTFGRDCELDLVRVRNEIKVHYRYAFAGVVAGVLAREWMNGVRTQRTLACGACATTCQGGLEFGHPDRRIVADSDVKDGKPGVLAYEHAFTVGDLDVVQDGQHELVRRLVLLLFLGLLAAFERCANVLRDILERADIKISRGSFDYVIDIHGSGPRYCDSLRRHKFRRR